MGSIKRCCPYYWKFVTSLAIVGLVLGILGLNEIKQNEESGRKMAITGIICSIVAIVFPIILAIVALYVFMSPGEIFIR